MDCGFLWADSEEVLHEAGDAPGRSLAVTGKPSLTLIGTINGTIMYNSLVLIGHLWYLPIEVILQHETETGECGWWHVKDFQIFSGQSHHADSILWQPSSCFYLSSLRRLGEEVSVVCRGPPRMCSFICLSKPSLKMRIWCCWLVAIQRSLQQFGDMALCGTELDQSWLVGNWFTCQIRTETNEVCQARVCKSVSVAMQSASICNVHSC